jgi:hypothetical protein
VEFLEKRKKLREVAGNHGVDLRTAALQFSASPDVAAALVVGASSEQQILSDYTSMQPRIPAKFWAELKTQKLIEKMRQPLLEVRKTNVMGQLASITCDPYVFFFWTSTVPRPPLVL